MCARLSSDSGETGVVSEIGPKCAPNVLHYTWVNQKETEFGL